MHFKESVTFFAFLGPDEYSIPLRGIENKIQLLLTS